jgi:hypothetical protein
MPRLKSNSPAKDGDIPIFRRRYFHRDRGADTAEDRDVPFARRVK